MVSRFNVVLENKERISRGNFQQVEESIQRLEKDLQNYKDEQDELHIQIL